MCGLHFPRRCNKTLLNMSFCETWLRCGKTVRSYRAPTLVKDWGRINMNHGVEDFDLWSIHS